MNRFALIGVVLAAGVSSLLGACGSEDVPAASGGVAGSSSVGGAAGNVGGSGGGDAGGSGGASATGGSGGSGGSEDGGAGGAALWVAESAGTNEDLLALSGTGLGGQNPTAAFAVGTNGTVLKWTPSASSWESLGSTIGTGSTRLLGVEYQLDGSGTIVGETGSVHLFKKLHDPGSTSAWSHYAIPNAGELRATATTGPDWYVGGASGKAFELKVDAYGKIYGATALPGVPSDVTLNAMVYRTHVSTEKLFAAGSDGHVYVYDRLHPTSGWKAVGVPTTQALHAIATCGLQELRAVGDGGVCLTSKDGDTWTQESTGTTENLYGLCCETHTAGYAVGAGGTILALTDAVWSREESGTTAKLTGVTSVLETAYGPTHVFAVGVNGTILRRNSDK